MQNAFPFTIGQRRHQDKKELVFHIFPSPRLFHSQPAYFPAPRRDFHDGNRKTSEKANVFCNLAPAVDSTSGGAASCRAGAEGERGGRKNISRKVRQGRKVSARRAGGKNSRGAAEARRAWRTLVHKRTKRKQKGGWRAGGSSTLKTMKTASRTWKAGGRRMGCRGGGRFSRRENVVAQKGRQARITPCFIRLRYAQTIKPIQTVGSPQKRKWQYCFARYLPPRKPCVDTKDGVLQFAS